MGDNVNELLNKCVEADILEKPKTKYYFVKSEVYCGELFVIGNDHKNALLTEKKEINEEFCKNISDNFKMIKGILCDKDFIKKVNGLRITALNEKKANAE